MEGNGTGHEMGLVGDHQSDPISTVADMNNNNNDDDNNNNNEVVDDVEHDNRSGSDNFELDSDSDELYEPEQEEQHLQEEEEQQHPNKKKKKYHRHTQRQINELENFFKDVPHPDDKQRMALSRKLGLESKQIKFWFQNRRTQMKTQLERHENIILRQENDKLRAENALLRRSINDPTCTACGGPVIPAVPDSSADQQQLAAENTRLKEELSRVCSLANKFLGRPLSSSAVPNPPPLGLSPSTTSRFGGLATNNNAFGAGLDFTAPKTVHDKSMFVEFALGAMNELLKMVHIDEPLWIKNNVDQLGTNKEILNLQEYARVASPSLALKRTGFITEATRETGVIVINSLAIVETLMDVNRWAETFNGMVARCSTIDVISPGIAGTKDGSLQLMQADFQVISPLVPVRQAKFLRFCKQHAEGVWAVVDISLDASQEGSSSYAFPRSMRLPSGCVMQDLPNGYCKVTWVEHSEYDDTYVHRLLRPVVSSGVGFGAKRWIATLQRYCECIAILLSSPSPDETLMTLAGKKSAIKLANRMVESFCLGVCDSNFPKWEKVKLSNNKNPDVKIVTRNNANEPGEPRGVVLSASTSVWLPASRQRLFQFLSNIQTRSEWDILSNGVLMQEMLHIVKGQHVGNCISIIRAATPVLEDGSVGEDSRIVVLQETWHDESASLLVYAPVDVQSMEVVLNGGDTTFVAMLPSGFAIFPDGHGVVLNVGDEGGQAAAAEGMTGCILTIGFQILVNNLPVGKLTMDSVDTVNNLLSCTVQRIKDSLHLP